MFLGLPDPHPDPLVTRTDPAQDPSIIKQKIVRKTLISTVLWGSLCIFTSVPDPLDRGTDPTPEDPDCTKNVTDPQHGR